MLHYNHLSNRYFAMRHGHSIANLQGIIVSQSKNGLKDYGLSEKGEAQVKKSVQKDFRLDSDTLIISSDFKRARESAEIVHRILECKIPVCFDIRLRERRFGELELSSDSGYTRVWKADEINPENRTEGVESANQVMERVTAVVCAYEKKITNATLLIVSHGDALQLLQTAFSKQSASRHRYQQHLDTAEIRRLNIGRGVEDS
ncbi:MAG: histidine phosphatase family protein [Gammaproteobacteria bacterium]